MDSLFAADASGSQEGSETTERYEESVVSRPMVSAEEVAGLSSRFGRPIRRTYHVQADDYIYSYRWRKDIDRRAEVVFAIQEDTGKIWVHTKPHYPPHIFRLPSGGIHWNEPVEVALMREVGEETGLGVQIERFLGLIEYVFFHGDSTVKFASYVFHLYSEGGQPVIHESEQISAFRAVLPSQIPQLALDLRNLIGDRRGWGQWRALAHDLVHESLAN